MLLKYVESHEMMYIEGARACGNDQLYSGYKKFNYLGHVEKAALYDFEISSCAFHTGLSLWPLGKNE